MTATGIVAMGEESGITTITKTVRSKVEAEAESLNSCEMTVLAV
jgi:hypothetical protein